MRPQNQATQRYFHQYPSTLNHQQDQGGNIVSLLHHGSEIGPISPYLSCRRSRHGPSKPKNVTRVPSALPCPYELWPTKGHGAVFGHPQAQLLLTQFLHTQTHRSLSFVSLPCASTSTRRPPACGTQYCSERCNILSNSEMTSMRSPTTSLWCSVFHVRQRNSEFKRRWPRWYTWRVSGECNLWCNDRSTRILDRNDYMRKEKKECAGLRNEVRGVLPPSLPHSLPPTHPPTSPPQQHNHNTPNSEQHARLPHRVHPRIHASALRPPPSPSLMSSSPLTTRPNLLT